MIKTYDRPIPEDPITIAHQLKWLRLAKRIVVYLPLGTQIPKIPSNREILFGSKGAFIYNHKKISAEAIQAAIDGNYLGRILGFGIDEKPMATDIFSTVVIRDKNGIEKQSVVTDAKHFDMVWRSALLVSDLEDTIKSEDLNIVLSERVKLRERHIAALLNQDWIRSNIKRLSNPNIIDSMRLHQIEGLARGVRSIFTHLEQAEVILAMAEIMAREFGYAIKLPRLLEI